MKQLCGWLFKVAKPTLGPLGAAVFWRHIDQLLGIALLVLPLGWVASAVADEPWPSPAAPVMAGLLIFLAIAKAVSRYLEQFNGHRVAFQALELLRQELFQSVSRRATLIRREQGSGDVLVRATKDIDRIEVFFAHTFPPLVTAITIPIAGMILVGFLSGWVAAGILAIGWLCAGVLVPALGRRSAWQAAKAAGAHRGKLAQQLTDSVQGAKEIVSYGRVADRLKATDTLMRQAPATTALAGIRAASRAVVAPLVLLSTALAIQESTDLLTACMTLGVVWRAMEAVAPVAGFTDTLPTTMAAARRVHQLASLPQAPAPAAHPVSLPAGALGIAWSDVSYQHPGSNRSPALDSVTVAVAPGSHICLVGSSGSGKSTLLELAARFDDPSCGQVLIGGVDIREIAAPQLRQRVQYVPQETVLFDLTVAENLRLGSPDATDGQLWEALTTAGVAAMVKALPQGLDTQLGEHGDRLSGGERQRLGLARGLVKQPDLLLLDEFTSHLDPKLAAEVRKNLRTNHPGLTIVEATHTLAGIDTADQVIVLEAGRLRPDLLATWRNRALN